VLWYEHLGVRVWVGWHRLLGPLVFDPTDQEGVGSGQVRLYLASKNRLDVLPRRATRAAIEPADPAGLRQAAETYCASRSRRRQTPPTTGERSSPNCPEPRGVPGAIPEPVNPLDVKQRQPGVCAGCRLLIPAERLHALPDAVRCVRCQAAWEQETGGTPPPVVDLGEAWFPRSEHWRHQGRRKRR
jgi:hypothetical protein